MNLLDILDKHEELQELSKSGKVSMQYHGLYHIEFRNFHWAYRSVHSNTFYPLDREAVRSLWVSDVVVTGIKGLRGSNYSIRFEMR